MCLVCFQKTIFRDKGSFLPCNPQEGDRKTRRKAANPPKKGIIEIRTEILFPVCTGKMPGFGQKKFLGLYPSRGLLHALL